MSSIFMFNPSNVVSIGGSTKLSSNPICCTKISTVTMDLYSLNKNDRYWNINFYSLIQTCKAAIWDGSLTNKICGSGSVISSDTLETWSCVSFSVNFWKKINTIAY